MHTQEDVSTWRHWVIHASQQDLSLSLPPVHREGGTVGMAGSPDYFKHWRRKNNMGKCSPPSGSPSTVGMGSKHGSIHCNRGIAAGTPLSVLGSGASITSQLWIVLVEYALDKHHVVLIQVMFSFFRPSRPSSMKTS